MGKNYSKSKRKGKKIPPQRGQIKVQIFESFAKTVISVLSKAGNALKTNKGSYSSGDGGTSSTAATPQLSSYNSDGQV